MPTNKHLKESGSFAFFNFRPLINGPLDPRFSPLVKGRPIVPRHSSQKQLPFRLTSKVRGPRKVSNIYITKPVWLHVLVLSAWTLKKAHKLSC